MALKLKQPKFADDEIVVAVDGFSSGNDTVSRGTRLRGNHRLVRDFPSLFVRDGTPQNEWPSVWDHLVENPVEHPPPAGWVEAIPDAEACIAEQSFSLGLTGRNIRKGDRLRRDNPMVQKHPHLFRTVGVLVSEIA